MRKLTAMSGAAAALALAAAFFYPGSPPAPAAPLGVSFPEYEPQKVVYHVTAGAGWFGSEHRQRLRILGNHVKALPAGSSDLRVVMQGEGLDLLIAAKSDAALAAEIDRLKAAGVRFVICANTIVARKIDFDRAVYGASRVDLVRAGVAETARLQAAGFVYIKV